MTIASLGTPIYGGHALKIDEALTAYLAEKLPYLILAAPNFIFIVKNAPKGIENYQEFFQGTLAVNNDQLFAKAVQSFGGVFPIISTTEDKVKILYGELVVLNYSDPAFFDYFDALLDWIQGHDSLLGFSVTVCDETVGVD